MLDGYTRRETLPELPFMFVEALDVHESSKYARVYLAQNQAYCFLKGAPL